MKVKEYIQDCIDNLSDAIYCKYNELYDLENQVKAKEKEIHLLELKQDVYKDYLINGRRFKNGTN